MINFHFSRGEMAELLTEILGNRLHELSMLYTGPFSCCRGVRCLLLPRRTVRWYRVYLRHLILAEHFATCNAVSKLRSELPKNPLTSSPLPKQLARSGAKGLELVLTEDGQSCSAPTSGTRQPHKQEHPCPLCCMRQRRRGLLSTFLALGSQHFMRT